MSFIAGYLMGLEDSGGGVSDIHEIYLAQTPVLTFEPFEGYSFRMCAMPDSFRQSDRYMFSDYTNSTPEGHFFALAYIYSQKPFAAGFFKDDEYYGIVQLANISAGYTIYNPNSDYTGTYLSYKETPVSTADYEIYSISYDYSHITTYTRCKATYETVSRSTEGGELQKGVVTKNMNLLSMGSLTYMMYPYAGAEKLDACIRDYAKLCNQKYHNN